MSTATRKSKRRHSQAFPEEQEEQVTATDDAPTYVESTGQDRLDKERDVWDAFKDEHVEVFDLSSILPRRFDLVREVDQRTSQNRDTVLDTLRKYIAIRRAAAQDSEQPDLAFRARDLLTEIAHLCDKSIEDGHEKTNICKTAWDTVERSIRLIDQAIQDQEKAIAPPGTHLAPDFLPVIPMPSLKKPARFTLSPDPDEKDPDYMTAKPDRRKKSRKGRKKDVDDSAPFVRPKPPVILNPDPNEQIYCYCDQVSFGEMVGCDDKKCKREWFHVVCTGMDSAPEGSKKWFCDECKERKKKRPR
ncbi:hypothetical protein FB45DRAFT_916489 [Roridomyces roridus]|uniref:Chromatin modification-related protein n=1 Tax=Roridomyces roridus TaxID=1738132 RepID=A0AAD7BUE8_9AGAR|nr:hypothetical protein FB45DRAFT_916489 [Roridomyces roridus]